MKLKLILFIYGLLLVVTSIFINNIILLISIFYIYALSIIFTYCRGTLSDPRILILGLFVFYSTFFPLRVYILEHSILPLDFDIILITLKYNFFALFVMTTVFNLVIKEQSKNKLKEFFIKNHKYDLHEEIIFYFLFSALIILSFMLANSGATSKIDLNSSSSVKGLSVFLFLMLTSATLMHVTRLEKNPIFDYKFQMFVILTIYFMLSTGERDIALRFLLLSLIIYYDKRQSASFILVISILVSIAFVVPILQSFKAILLTDVLVLKEFSFNMIFSNEFISAGRNFYALLFYGVEHDFNFFFNDIIRGLAPSFILPDDIVSTGAWFGREFRTENGFDGTSGWGFSLVAQGYLIGGSLGILFIMSLYSFVISALYNIRLKSIYWYVMYLLALASSIYVLRADFANFSSQVFKIGGLSMFYLFILSKLLNGKIKV
jgi:oligosaccharide repeat unit polymerase